MVVRTTRRLRVLLLAGIPGALALAGGCASPNPSPAPAPAVQPVYGGKLDTTKKDDAASEVAVPRPPKQDASPLGNKDYRAREIFVKACDYLDAREFEIASSEFDRALVLKPDYYQAWFKKGLCFYYRQQYALEIECYKRCLQVSPDYVPALQNLAAALFAADDLEGAVRIYHKLLDLDPKHHDALYNLGIAYSALEEYSLAVQCLQRFMDAYPNDALREKAQQHATRAREKLGTQR